MKVFFMVFYSKLNFNHKFEGFTANHIKKDD